MTWTEEKDMDSIVENQKRVEEKVDGLMSRLEGKSVNMEAVEDTQKRMENKVDVLMNSLEGKSVDVNSVHNCVEDAVKVQLQDNNEKEEIRKRKTSLIIHVLEESSASVLEDRKKCR